MTKEDEAEEARRELARQAAAALAPLGPEPVPDDERADPWRNVR